MRLWLLVIFACIIQEFTTTNAILLSAYHVGYSLWVIHAIYLAATVADFFVGYWLGLWVYRHLSGSRFAHWAERFVERYVERLGTTGKRYLLFLIGAFNFTYLNAFLVPWLRVSWEEAFIIFVSANLVWYALQWAFILGVNLLFPNPLEALAAIVVFSLAGIACWKLGAKRLLSRW